jgi:hypothetical protein
VIHKPPRLGAVGMLEVEGPGRVVGAGLVFFPTVEVPAAALVRVLVTVVAAARLRVVVALAGDR